MMRGIWGGDLTEILRRVSVTRAVCVRPPHSRRPVRFTSKATGRSVHLGISNRLTSKAAVRPWLVFIIIANRLTSKAAVIQWCVFINISIRLTSEAAVRQCYRSVGGFGRVHGPAPLIVAQDSKGLTTVGGASTPSGIGPHIGLFALIVNSFIY